MATSVRTAAEQAGVETADLSGVGIGSPGVIDARRGVVSSARNLPNWEGSFKLGEALTEALGARVKIDNDVNVATDAELSLGAGRPYRSMLGVFWGTGVGGGIVLRGRPWLGRGAAGEIGHVCVVMEGRAAHAAGAAASRRTPGARRSRNAPATGTTRATRRSSSRSWRSAGATGSRAASGRGRVEHDDKLAHKLIDEAVDALGAGVASTLNVLDVEAVILGAASGCGWASPTASGSRRR